MVDLNNYKRITQRYTTNCDFSLLDDLQHVGYGFFEYKVMLEFEVISFYKRLFGE